MLPCLLGRNKKELLYAVAPANNSTHQLPSYSTLCTSASTCLCCFSFALETGAGPVWDGISARLCLCLPVSPHPSSPPPSVCARPIEHCSPCTPSCPRSPCRPRPHPPIEHCSSRTPCSVAPLSTTATWPLFREPDQRGFHLLGHLIDLRPGATHCLKGWLTLALCTLHPCPASAYVFF